MSPGPVGWEWPATWEGRSETGRYTGTVEARLRDRPRRGPPEAPPRPGPGVLQHQVTRGGARPSRTRVPGRDCGDGTGGDGPLPRKPAPRRLRVTACSPGGSGRGSQGFVSGPSTAPAGPSPRRPPPPGPGPVLGLRGTLTLRCAAAGSRPPAAAVWGARPAGAGGPRPRRWPAASALPGASARPVLWLRFLRKRGMGLGGSGGRGPSGLPYSSSKPP